MGLAFFHLAKASGERHSYVSDKLLFNRTHHFSNVRQPWDYVILLPMGGNIISRFLFDCRHQFSWPRRDDNGDYYQLCVTCGTKYQYDWTRMRRIAPIDDTPKPEDSKSTIRRCGTKSAWTPRERRLKHEVPVLYRALGSQDWMEGTTENISRSGVLFRSAVSIEAQTKLELKFEMPKELTGETPAQVVCHATVQRVIPNAGSKKQPPSFNLACAVADYDFAEKKIEKAAEATTAPSANLFEFTKRQRRVR
jgi:hypothetical protein